MADKLKVTLVKSPDRMCSETQKNRGSTGSEKS